MALKNPSSDLGFTMIELTMVGITITILIAIALPNFLEAQIRAKVTASETDLALLGASLEEYYIEYRSYPPNVADSNGEGGLVGDNNPNLRGAALVVLTTPVSYLSVLPVDDFITEKYERNTYDYVDFTGWTGSAISRSSVVEGEQGSAAYVLVGIGPNLEYEFTASKPPSSGIDYSPTNGTRSVGDLMLFGP
ncbi:MAG: hypothetical protein KC944_16650 [Candidatus Omnitrophica bacterium]|nr:hypothetical protein [Candidatus Omnitrophota bacterium]